MPGFFVGCNMRKIQNLHAKGYGIFHNQTGVQWGITSDTTAKIKTRFTKAMQYKPYADRDGVDHNVKFDKQFTWGLHQIINPVVLMKFLETEAPLFGNTQELIDYLKENISEGKIK